MNNNNPASISIIIPCRNEEDFIVECLNSIISNDLSTDGIEIVVVDGMSEDRTRRYVRKYSKNYPCIKLLDNPQKNTSTALNIGIKESNGNYIMILSSHSKVEKNFIKTNIDNLEKNAADCVGGVMITIPANNTLLAQAIALTLSHPFGVGNSYFRIGSKELKYVDTVPFGCYKKEIFENIGYFDENLVRNQDIEFNLRLKKASGKILLNPNIISYYYARPNLKDLFKQNFSNGFWVIYSLKFAKLPFSIRHLVPFTFVFSLLSSFTASLVYFPFFYLLAFIISLYLISNISFSIELSIKNGFKCLPWLVLTFFTLHFSYGLGSLWGIVKIIMSKFRIIYDSLIHLYQIN